MSKTQNYRDSLNNVISTVTHVLFGFEDMVREEIPDLPVVYDKELSYPTAIKLLLAKHNDQDPLPFLAYNRTVARPTEMGIGRRVRTYEGIHKLEGNNIHYGASYDEFDLNFMFVSKSMEDIEKFEITYNSDEGISGTKELVIDMSDLGDFKYFLKYNEISDLDIEHEGTYHKAIIGSITVRGFYFTFRSTSGIIKEINAKIWHSKGINHESSVLLEQEIIEGINE